MFFICWGGLFAFWGRGQARMKTQLFCGKLNPVFEVCDWDAGLRILRLIEISQRTGVYQFLHWLHTLTGMMRAFTGFQRQLVPGKWQKKIPLVLIDRTLRSFPLISLGCSSGMSVFTSPWPFWSPHPVASTPPQKSSASPGTTALSFQSHQCGICGSLAWVWEWFQRAWEV